VDQQAPVQGDAELLGVRRERHGADRLRLGDAPHVVATELAQAHHLAREVAPGDPPAVRRDHREGAGSDLALVRAVVARCPDLRVTGVRPLDVDQRRAGGSR
jgi:hypothetical protein